MAARMTARATTRRYGSERVCASRARPSKVVSTDRGSYACARVRVAPGIEEEGGWYIAGSVRVMAAGVNYQ